MSDRHEREKHEAVYRYRKYPKRMPEYLTRSLTVDEKIAMETAYRRGFHHGAVMALSAVASNATDAELETWLSELMRWRRAKHNGAFVGAPSEPSNLPQFRYGEAIERNEEAAIAAMLE